ncbi:hypothetical protein BpHYR1_035446 [Brachionus plicatilis]|uniref:Uncharacterized protein n=1 Tax=Brachionus plicatilis TaxID=10195 RepID=A0A3M7SRI9_BRAPC|nr:hypothetical protein BpHYR1_035446 [Brachionus plicatilis]
MSNGVNFLESHLTQNTSRRKTDHMIRKLYGPNDILKLIKIFLHHKKMGSEVLGQFHSIKFVQYLMPLRSTVFLKPRIIEITLIRFNLFDRKKIEVKKPQKKKEDATYMYIKYVKENEWI